MVSGEKPSTCSEPPARRAPWGARALGAVLPLVLAACGTQADPEPTAPEIPPDARAALERLSPSVLPAPPADTSNRWADDPEAAAFGQRLFFDPRFSGSLLDGDNDGSEHALGRRGETGKVACAGCHLPEYAFADGRTLGQEISLAAGWGKRKSPSLLDVGQSKILLWSGRRDSFQSQIFGVIESEVEMNSSRLFAAYAVAENHRDEYEALFDSLPPFDDTSRFPPLDVETTGCRLLDSNMKCVTPMRGAPGDGAEFDGLTPEDQEAVTRVVVNAGTAIGAYERLLTCGRSRFDDWMAGDANALTPEEQRGALLFVGKARCDTCHSGPYFSDEKFHNVGLKPEVVAVVFLDLDDKGAGEGLVALQSDELNVRGVFSDGDDGRIPEVEPAHTGAFRTPRLRCASQRPSYMHTGHIATLEEVVEFFDRGGDPFGYLGTKEIEPLELSESERADLAAFLRALDGPGPDDALLAQP